MSSTPSRVEAIPAVKPKEPGVPLTTHTYQLITTPNYTITLTLTTSHAPLSTQSPVYFAPGDFAGEVVLDIKKPSSIRGVGLSVRIQQGTSKVSELD